MGWRTDQCGCTSGAGCAHQQPSPLCVVPGEHLTVDIPTPIPTSSGPARAQVRTTPNGGRLLLDLLPYLTADPTDPNLVTMDLPPAATTPLTTSGYWDIWIGGERAAHGPFIVGRSISSGPGKLLTTTAWQPTITIGEPFHRTISTDGLLPPDQRLTTEPPPALTLTSTDRSTSSTWTGAPELSIDPEHRTISIRLDHGAPPHHPLGTSTYTLTAATTTTSSSTILAGTATITSGRT